MDVAYSHERRMRPGFDCDALAGSLLPSYQQVPAIVTVPGPTFAPSGGERGGAEREEREEGEEGEGATWAASEAVPAAFVSRAPSSRWGRRRPQTPARRRALFPPLS